MLTLAGLKKVQARNVLMNFPVQENSLEDKTPEEILAKYREDIARIDSYAVAVCNLNISIYGKAPDWYNEDFKTKFVNSKAHAQIWLNDIMSRLKEVPETITGYNSIYQMYSGEILDNCKLLLKNPEKNIEQQVTGNIRKLKEAVSARKDVIADLETAIDKYIDNLTQDKAFFDDAYKKACGTKDVQKELLEKFKKNKEELEDEINYLRDVVMGTGITGGVLLAAAPIGFFFGPIGIAIGIFVTAAALANLLAAIAESARCSQKEEELQVCISQMNDVTKTIQSLELFCTGIEKIIAVALEAKSAAQEIKGYWDQLEKEMEDLSTHLQKGGRDMQEKLYEEIIDEINIANEEWTKIVETAKIYAQLNIEVKKEVINVSKSA